MRLADQITWKLTAVVAGLVLVAGGGVWAIWKAREDAELVRNEYLRQQTVNDAAVRVGNVRLTALDIATGHPYPRESIDKLVERIRIAHHSLLQIGRELESVESEEGARGNDPDVRHDPNQVASQLSDVGTILENALNALDIGTSRPYEKELFDKFVEDIRAAQVDLQQIRRELVAVESEVGSDFIDPDDRHDLTEAEARVSEVRTILENAVADPLSFDPLQLFLPLSAARRALTGLHNRSVQRVQRIHEATAGRMRTTTGTLIGVSMIVIVGVFALSIWQYRSVIVPIDRLRAGVHRIAAGDFGHRLDARGCTEFATLAGDFNRTAATLHDVMTELEERVRATSKKLAQSEQLAGVGYLAAAVSHEINNPIGIMAGYAESALRIATRKPADHVPAEVREALEIIRDEAFRCKKITAQLLSLSQRSDEPIENVSLAAVIREVAEMLRGLDQFADRRIDVRLAADDELWVRMSALEVKQALLNIAVNALEAAPPKTGVVTFGGRHTNAAVQVTVADNGRGMTPDVLERVFEPFFTTRRSGQGTGGVGLGMSITQTIIERHGGHITAASDGPERGSVFTITLPASDPALGKADA